LHTYPTRKYLVRQKHLTQSNVHAKLHQLVKPKIASLIIQTKNSSLQAPNGLEAKLNGMYDFFLIAEV
jgi:hypothetical protein